MCDIIGEMIDIHEEKRKTVTFNFFRRNDCSGFKFCHSYKINTNDIAALMNMTPEERLAELTEFLQRGNKGRSCEFYYNGEFWKCAEMKEKVKKMLKARKLKKAQ